MPKEIEIQPVGSFFEADAEGYLINPASLDKVQEKWKPVIDDVIEAYKKEYGEHLISVYIRGSVAKGQAKDYISDLDTFAFVDLTREEIKSDWKKRHAKNCMQNMIL